jgi:hypothetical protein
MAKHLGATKLAVHRRKCGWDARGLRRPGRLGPTSSCPATPHEPTSSNAVSWSERRPDRRTITIAADARRKAAKAGSIRPRSKAISCRGKEDPWLRVGEKFDWCCGRYPLSHRCGTGLIGMWKAFSEMETLGWTGSADRECSRCASGCASIVRIRSR